MNTTFNCYNSVIIENPDSNPYYGIFSGFDYVNMSAYGGDSYTVVTSNQDIIDAFAALGIPVKLNGYEIVILDTTYSAVNLTSSKNPEIKFTDALSVDTCITTETRFNLAFYGGDSIEFLYSIEEIKTRLEFLTQVDVTVTTCGAIFDKYPGSVQDIIIDSDPTATYTISTVATSIDFGIHNAIDLTPYGGTIIGVTTEAQVITAFAALGITITFDDTAPILVEYTGAVYPIELCLIDTFEITGFNFDKVNFPVEYGGTQVLNSPAAIQSYLATNYSTSTTFVNNPTGYTYTVVTPVCTEIANITTDIFNVVSANPDIYEFCIEQNTSFSTNILGNDSMVDGEEVIKINGQSVVTGTSVNIAAGLDIIYEGNGDIQIVGSNDYVSNLTDTVTYTIRNNDNQEAGSFIQFCFADTPVVNPDAVTMTCNTPSALLTVLANDFTAYNNLTITHINNIQIGVQTSINLEPGLDITSIDTAVGFIITPSDDYQGSGSISYTVTNGAFTATGYVEYVVSDCDPCVTNNLTFPVTADCAELCWSSLLNSLSPVANFILQFLDSSGNPVENANGDIIKVANGTFYDSSSTLPIDTCIPFKAGDYSVEIIDSDLGSNLLCPSLDFTMLPVTCDGNPCTFSYNGPGGVASSLQFNVEVGPTATITIVDFEPYSQPDGIVIEYNGSVIYHTGLSATMPYISDAITSFVCSGIIYTSQIVPDPVNVDISVPYIPGVETALVSIYGKPCTTTGWNLTIKCTA